MADFELPLLQVDSVIGLGAAELGSDLVLVNRDPSPGETDIPVGTNIRLELIALSGKSISLPTVRVQVNGADAAKWTGSGVFAVSPYAGPGASVSTSSSRVFVTLDPVFDFSLPSMTVVEVVVEASLTDGTTLRESYAFGLEDHVGPALTGVQALDQRTLRVTFDEPVVAVLEPFFELVALGAPAVLPGVESVSVFPEGVVEVLLDTEISPGVEYRITATGIADLADNSAVPPYDTATFVGFVPPFPPERRFDLWSMLPKHNRADDTTGDLAKFIACLQEVATLLLYRVDRYVEIFDFERAPEAFLDLILQDLGNPFQFDLTVDEKRRLVSVLVDIYLQKGTRPGIINAIRFFLGVEVTIDQFAQTAMILGESLLGFDWELGPRGSFSRYAFTVTSPVELTATQRKRMRTIVNYMKPAHTHFVELIEPPPAPYVPDHWEIGESLLGVESYLHTNGTPPSLLTEGGEPLLTENNEPITV